MASQNGINNKVTDNDFTVNNQDCGATAFISVTNDCTDASSDALFQAVSASATAGDPAINFEVNAVTDWALGIDNSVTSPAADPFVISASSALGTTNVMTIQTAGEMNLPLQPAFLGVKNTEQTNATGNGTNVIVSYDAEIFDQNSDFNITTYTFTAPVTGRYYFSFEIAYGELSASSTRGQAYLDTSNRAVSSFFGGPGSLRSTTGVGANSWINIGGCLVDMDASDTAVVRTFVEGMGSDTVDLTTGVYFGGYLCC